MASAAASIVPIHQAGGGNPSAISSTHTIATLETHVTQHLKNVYDKLCGDSPTIPAEILNRFLNGTQKATEQDKAGLLQAAPQGITFFDFVKYAQSTAMTAMGPPPASDLKYPMSNYFISSSHNTYLTGNQLYGKSNTDGYKSVLLRSCRCIEIDVWDGESHSDSGSDDEAPKVQERPDSRRQHLSSRFSSMKEKAKDKAKEKVQERRDMKHGSLATPPSARSTSAMRAEPVVFHGYTLTRKIPFREVCHAIKENAFVTSDLPVIVSLEVHAGSTQQKLMVAIMREVWGDMLIDEAHGITSDENSLPSPAELMRKILIKVKYNKPPPEAAPTQEIYKVRTDVTTSSSDDEIGEDGKKKKKSKVIPDLSNLGIYTRSYHFSSFTQAEAQIPTHVFSLSERGLKSAHEQHAAELFAHNRDFLMRAYPLGLRVSSSNLDPSIFWRKGVQMVALNWQKCDEGVMLNEAMFAGTAGWVLKPSGYRSTTSPVEQAASQASAIRHQTLNLTIEVLAAQKIPLPEGDKDDKSFHPYVKVEVHVEEPEELTGEGIPSGGKAKDSQHKRKTRSRSGRSPDFGGMFGGDVLSFDEISGVVEELSFVRFKVHDDELGHDDIAAWACIRLDRLQSGYRFVHLMDWRGVESEGALLVRISKDLK